MIPWHVIRFHSCRCHLPFHLVWNQGSKTRLDPLLLQQHFSHEHPQMTVELGGGGSLKFQVVHIEIFIGVLGF